MLIGIFVIIHILVAVGLIMIILLQAGKGAGMGAAFGGSSQTLFGSTGRATFLSKVTIAAAVIFAITSISLSIMRTQPAGVMEGFKPAQPVTPEVPQLPTLPPASPTDQNAPAPGPEGAAPGANAPAGNVVEIPLTPVTPETGEQPPAIPEETPPSVPPPPTPASPAPATPGQ